MAGKDLVGSTLYGESMLISGQPVRVSGELVRIQGYDYGSAVHRTVAVDKSGQILVNVEIADIVQARISGQTVISKISGQAVSIIGGVNVSGATIIARVSGQTVISKISGAQVAVTGTVIISGTIVSRISGQSVKISGQTVYLAGTPAIGISGAAVIAKISGQTVVAKTSGQTHISKISGQAVSIIGGVNVSGATIIARVSGQRVETSISGNVLNISGQVTIAGDVVSKISGQTIVAKTSGQTVVAKTSGQTVISKISGEEVQIIPASDVRWQRIICSALSGGTAFNSCQVRSAIFRALSSTIWTGGNQAGHYPYQGGGMPLDGGEAFTQDVDNLNRIRGCAMTSGAPLVALGIY